MHLPRRHTGFRRRALIIGLVTAAVAGVMVLFGVHSVQRIQTVEQRWTVYSQDAAEAGRLLHNISRQMGYGGFIHNYKNYILRRDARYVIMLLGNQDTVYADLAALGRHMISDDEKAAVRAIRSVFDLYVNAIPIAQDSFERGLSSVEVDILIKVDDVPALNAIALLNHSFLTRSRLAERETNKAMRAVSSMVWVLLSVVPVIVLLGVMLVLFLRRIMDANDNLAEVRDELAMLLRQAPDAILHIDNDGLILRANDRSLTLFGYHRQQLLGKKIEDLIPGRFRDGDTGIRKSAFMGMGARSLGDGVELYAITKNGVEVPVDISVNFSQSGGKRIATAIIRDVTERKRAADALKQAHDELEQRVKERTKALELEISERQRAETQLVQSAKMATIGEMASGITHELNQPMNIMRLGVEAAQIKIKRGQADMDLMTQTLEKVEGQILRMSEIINHMRVYSRQDTEGQTLFDPYQAVREGCQLFSGQLSGVNVDLKLSMVGGHE
ncbi:MAG: PAS domain S-box protein, partial [Magnetovibrio sp.]|nr:PAS domain S-box protein [Magnetovibrio sp.]